MWNFQHSLDRILRQRDALPEITISPLERKMDISNITFSKPKSIVGAHLYVDVPNQVALGVSKLSPEDPDLASELLWRAHLYQRELSRVFDDFDVAKVHFQGFRAHILCYRPGSDEEVAHRALTLAAAVDMTVRRAFNPAFPDSVEFKTASGAAFGRVVGTRSGSPGDSELLFIGSAANRGAHAIDPATRLVVSSELAELAYGVDGFTFTDDDEDDFVVVSIDDATLPAHVGKLNATWNIEQCTERVESDIETFPLDKTSLSGATGEIDKDRLSLSNSKLVDGVSIFGDIDGFTNYVDELGDDNAAIECAVRDFHLIRSELRAVALNDFSGTLRVQYQGDRIQCLRHLPVGNVEDRAMLGVEVAAGWESSMTKTLPGVTKAAGSLRLTTGIAAASTIVSKLGERGNRDMICIGRGVRRADSIQRALEGGEVGISGTVHKALPDEVAALFQWETAKQAYVRADLDINVVEDAQAARDYGKPLAVIPLAVPTAVHKHPHPTPEPPRRRFAD